MKYLLAHDIGTSGNKATLFDSDGNLIASNTFPYEVIRPNNAWAEQDADTWYKSVCVLTRELIRNINPKDIIGVSFSGQMQGCLLVDDKGKPLHRAIIWADTRADAEENFILSKIDQEKFYKITGNRASKSYTLAKLLWIKNHKPDIYAQAYKVLNAKDYIIFKLTGMFVTDYSDASSTNLLDLDKQNWSEEISDKVGISLNKFPDIKYSTDVVGEIHQQASEDTGLARTTKVVCGGGDGAIAAIGAMAIKEGDAFGTIGTSAWNAVISSTAVYDKEMKTFTFAHAIPDLYIHLGTMQSAGASINWLKEQFFSEMCVEICSEVCSEEKKLINKSNDVSIDTETYKRIEKLLEKSSPRAGGVIFLPYLMGERSPWWNGDAKACFIGMSINTTLSDLCRSVYEGIALNLEIILQAINTHQTINNFVLTGGVAKSQVLCQIISDVYGIPLSILDHLEDATSIGAIVCAGVGTGVFNSFEAINKFSRVDHIVSPLRDNVSLYKELKPIFKDSYTSLKDIFFQISNMNK